MRLGVHPELCVMRSEEFFQVDPSVFILESPSEDDLRAGRIESEALEAALRLACIPTVRYLVKDRPTLKDALARAAASAARKPRGRPVAPTVHISAHGNVEGIGLTDGTLLTWAELREALLEFARASGRLSPGGVGLVDLCMSTCEGAHAAKMFDIGAPYPCFGIVGPTAKVAWTDSLVAYVTFYHLKVTKDLMIPEVIGPMNKAAGVEVFAALIPADLASRMSPRAAMLSQQLDRLRSTQPPRPPDDGGNA